MSTLRAMSPQDVSRLIEESAARGDLDAVASLYEDGAVMASESGCVTVGRAGIVDAWAHRLGRLPGPRPPWCAAATSPWCPAAAPMPWAS